MNHGANNTIAGKLDSQMNREKSESFSQQSEKHDCEAGERRNVKLPLDRGYAWVIMLTTTTVEILLRGIQKSFGLLFFDLKEELKADFTEISLISGLFNGMGQLVAPIGSLLVNRFSCRFTTIVGAVLMCIGLALSFVASDVIQMSITLGIVVGSGIGLVDQGSSVIIGRYFNNRLSTANGVRMAGATIASIIYPYLILFLLESLAFRGTILILSGITLHIIVFAFSYRNFPRNLEERISTQGQINKAFEMESIPDVLSNIKEIPPQIIYASSEPKNKNRVQILSYQRTNSVNVKQSPRILTCEPHGASLADRLDESGFSLDFSLLTDPVFILLSLAFIAAAVHIDLFLVILPAHGEALGYGKDNAAQLLIIFSITDMIFRLLSGCVVDFCHMSRLYCYIVCNLILAVGNCFASFYNSYELLITYSAIYGIFWGFHTTLTIPIYVEYFGVDKLPSALAFYKPIAGIGTIVTQSFLGNLMKDSSQENGFLEIIYVIAGLAFTTTILLILTPATARCLKKKEESKNSKSQQIEKY